MYHSELILTTVMREPKWFETFCLFFCANISLKILNVAMALSAFFALFLRKKNYIKSFSNRFVSGITTKYVGKYNYSI